MTTLFATRFDGAFVQEVSRPYWLERVASNREGQRFTPARGHYSAKVTSQGAVKCPSPACLLVCLFVCLLLGSFVCFVADDTLAGSRSSRLSLSMPTAPRKGGQDGVDPGQGRGPPAAPTSTAGGRILSHVAFCVRVCRGIRTHWHGLGHKARKQHELCYGSFVARNSCPPRPPQKSGPSSVSPGGFGSSRPAEPSL